MSTPYHPLDPNVPIAQLRSLVVVQFKDLREDIRKNLKLMEEKDLQDTKMYRVYTALMDALGPLPNAAEEYLTSLERIIQQMQLRMAFMANGLWH